MGHFTEETLHKFNAMCVAGVDFGEGPVYDFTRCVKASGEAYGTQGACKSGVETPDMDLGGSKKDIRKIMNAYLQKTGKSMTMKQLVAAADKIGLPIPPGKTAEEFLKQLLPKDEKVVPIKPA